MDPRHAAFAAFLEDMQRGDADALTGRLASDVVLNRPSGGAPIVGREAVLRALVAIAWRTDDLTVHEILVGDRHLAASFRQRMGAETVDGMDYVRLDDDHRIVELMAFWRPVPPA